MRVKLKKIKQKIWLNDENKSKKEFNKSVKEKNLKIKK